MKAYNNKRNERLEKARAILEQGLDHIQQDSEALAAYLRFRAHFHKYSRQNTILIMMQRRSAQYCMGFKQWQKHGRYVRKGEKGLMIYAPILRKPEEGEVAAKEVNTNERVLVGFRITYVWDISQTEIIPGCEETALEFTSPIPKLGGSDFAHVFTDLTAVAERLGYRVERYRDRTEEGYCNFSNRIIGVRDDHAPNDAAAVLAHELVHAVAHKRRGGASHAVKELQAEGAAYLLCYALGLDTGHIALPYLKHYEEIADSDLVDQLDAIERLGMRLLTLVREDRVTPNKQELQL